MPGQRSQPTPTSCGSKTYVCFVVTCRMHFWQNDRGLSPRATAVTRGWNVGHRLRVCTESELWRKFCSFAPAGEGIPDLSITSPALYRLSYSDPHQVGKGLFNPPQSGLTLSETRFPNCVQCGSNGITCRQAVGDPTSDRAE